MSSSHEAHLPDDWAEALAIGYAIECQGAHVAHVYGASPVQFLLKLQQSGVVQRVASPLRRVCSDVQPVLLQAAATGACGAAAALGGSCAAVVATCSLFQSSHIMSLGPVAWLWRLRITVRAVHILFVGCPQWMAGCRLRHHCPAGGGCLDRQVAKTIERGAYGSPDRVVIMWQHAVLHMLCAARARGVFRDLPKAIRGADAPAEAPMLPSVSTDGSISFCHLVPDGQLAVLAQPVWHCHFTILRTKLSQSIANYYSIWFSLDPQSAPATRTCCPGRGCCWSTTAARHHAGSKEGHGGLLRLSFTAAGLYQRSLAQRREAKTARQSLRQSCSRCMLQQMQNPWHTA